MIRAKFRVADIKAAPINVTKHGQSVLVDGKIVTLYPVTADDCQENAEFYAATPNGQIQLSILNPASAAAFESGKIFMVDFTAVSG